MDLALAFGQPVETLARALPEGEFQDWQHYAAKRMLPMRRLELYLAQIAQKVVQSTGASAALSDFLFDPVEPSTVEPTAEEEAAFFDFNPR